MTTSEIYEKYVRQNPIQTLTKSRDESLALMHEWVASDALRKHMLAVEAAMTAYAGKFGEDAALEVSAVADRLGVDVPVLERNLRRRVDGIQLFEMKDDALGATTLQLSFECRHHLSRSLVDGRHAGTIVEGCCL